VITYPAGTSFSAIRLESKLGNTQIENLTCETLQLESSTGDVTMKDLSVDRLTRKASLGNYRAERVSAGVASIQTGSGDIQMKSFSTQGLALDSSMGNIAIEGTLHGKSEIRTQTGDVQLSLAQPERSLDYELETNLGDLIISGRRQDEDRIHRQVTGAADIMYVKTNMGNVRMDFRQ
jgi:DUF4097 and DUF4098 domain-containing protein YvlB